MKIRTKNGEIKEIIYNDKQLYNYGLNRLSSRDYLRTELFTKMKNLQPDESMVNNALDKLEVSGYLNDTRRIMSMFNAYSSRESVSKTQNRLIQKGASKDMIENALFEMENNDTKNYEYDSVTDSALSLIEKKFNFFNIDKKEKMLRFLISKGFNYSICSKVLKIFEEKFQ